MLFHRRLLEKQTEDQALKSDAVDPCPPARSEDFFNPVQAAHPKQQPERYQVLNAETECTNTGSADAYLVGKASDLLIE